VIVEGYTFWTTHPAYHKLHALYSMIFETRYRESICKDGLADRLAEGTIIVAHLARLPDGIMQNLRQRRTGLGRRISIRGVLRVM
jgi:hypothetical protein